MLNQDEVDVFLTRIGATETIEWVEPMSKHDFITQLHEGTQSPALHNLSGAIEDNVHEVDISDGLSSEEYARIQTDYWMHRSFDVVPIIIIIILAIAAVGAILFCVWRKRNLEQQQKVRIREFMRREVDRWSKQEDRSKVDPKTNRRLQ